MKRHNHLYQEIHSMPNLMMAHSKARRGKTHYDEVQVVDEDPMLYLNQLQNVLIKEDFKNSPYDVFLKRGKKDRYIYKLPYFPDRILHHAIMQVLERIWKSVLITDTYSSISNRGVHKGVRRMKGFLQDTYGTRYCLKVDVQKFYPSVNHDILMQLLQKKIKCKRTLRLLYEIIYSTEGLPIGNYLSQYFGNLYLTYFDHWVKEYLRVRCYSRYCDDIVFLAPHKYQLQDIKHQVVIYLKEKLSLRLHPNMRIFPVETGIDYLGYVFYPRKVRVRKSIVQAFKDKILHIKKHYAHLPYSQIINSLISYYGWFKHGTAIRLWKQYIDKEIQRIVRYISKKEDRKIPKIFLEVS